MISLFLCVVTLTILYLNPNQTNKEQSYQKENASNPDLDLSALTGFIENKGQIRDQHGQPNTAVKYHYVTDDFSVQLRETGFSYELLQLDTIEAAVNLLTHRIDINFVGAKVAQISTSAPTDVSTNFYQRLDAEKGLTGVQTFRKILYEGLYPNIDLSFEIHEDGQMEYHFIVREGGNPALIQLAYEGQNDLALLDNKVQIQTQDQV